MDAGSSVVYMRPGVARIDVSISVISQKYPVEGASPSVTIRRSPVVRFTTLLLSASRTCQSAMEAPLRIAALTGQDGAVAAQPHRGQPWPYATRAVPTATSGRLVPRDEV